MEETHQPITMSLDDLRSGTIDFSDLELAFGPASLGILIVTDLSPNFQVLRTKLLTYASHLAQLPSEELQSYYNVGWSHGKEALRSGVYDTLKGSYYAGVMSSHSCQSKTSFEVPNIWPKESVLPGFRKTFEDLCDMIFEVTLLVAKACDQYAGVFVQGYESGMLERLLKESTASRARLLHYFPPSSESQQQSSSSDAKLKNDDTWCALHVDDGCLTGLTSALFVDEALPLPPVCGTGSEQMPKANSTDPMAGLYILSRTNEVVQVKIPADCLAFQTGSALELMTRGALKAVPHFVRGPNASVNETRRIARNTLAVFTQPNLEEIIDRNTGRTFREHTRLSDENHA